MGFVVSTPQSQYHLPETGYVLARNRSEWPVDWDENAFFGAASTERGWGEGRLVSRNTRAESVENRGSTPAKQPDSTREDDPGSNVSSPVITTTEGTRPGTSHRSQEIQDVIVVERRPPRIEAAQPANIPGTPGSQIAHSMSLTSPAHKPSVTTVTITPPAQTPAATVPSPVLTPASIPSNPVKSPPDYSSGSHQIGTTPHHPLDADLVTLARKFDLSEPVVIAAKQIVLRHESHLNKTHRPVIARASLFAACRQLGIARTFNEFDSGLDQQKKSWWHKAFKNIEVLLKKEALAKSPSTKVGSLNNGLSQTETTSTSSHAVPPASSFPSSFSVQDFINSESKILGLTPAILSRALQISQHPSIDILFSGKRPGAIAAVILSFAAECEEFYIGTAPYAEAANVSVQNVAAGQKQLLKSVKEMAGKAGELPRAFRAKWNTPGYMLEGGDGN